MTPRHSATSEQYSNGAARHGGTSQLGRSMVCHRRRCLAARLSGPARWCGPCSSAPCGLNGRFPHLHAPCRLNAATFSHYISLFSLHVFPRFFRWWSDSIIGCPVWTHCPSWTQCRPSPFLSPSCLSPLYSSTMFHLLLHSSALLYAPSSPSPFVSLLLLYPLPPPILSFPLPLLLFAPTFLSISSSYLTLFLLSYVSSVLYLISLLLSLLSYLYSRYRISSFLSPLRSPSHILPTVSPLNPNLLLLRLSSLSLVLLDN